VKHLHAWFVNPDTRMNASLLYSQAIKGRFTGRSIGVIDTLHLAEVALGRRGVCAGRKRFRKTKRGRRHRLVSRISHMDNDAPLRRRREQREKTTTAPAPGCRLRASPFHRRHRKNSRRMYTV